MAEVKIELNVNTETGTARISAFNQHIVSAMDTIKAAGTDASAKIESAFKQLGVRSIQSIQQEKQALASAWREIARSGTASIIDVQRAKEAFTARVKTLNSEIVSITQKATGQVTLTWRSAVDNISSAWGWMKSQWMALAGAIATGYKLWQMGEAAASFQQTSQAFAGMAASMGFNADALMGKLREASGGIIDNKSLQEATNRAISLGLPVEKLGDLMLIARAKAREMGMTTTQAFDNIVVGIGRASPMIIDNLGLTMKEGEAYEKMAEQLHKTVEALTPAEQKMAILNAVMEAGAGAVKLHNLQTLTQAERLQKLGAEWENLKLVIGSVVLRIQMAIIGMVDGVKAYLNLLKTEIYAIALPFAWLTDRLKITQGAYDSMKENMKSAWGDTKKNIYSAADAFASVISSQEAYAMAFDKTNQKTKEQTGAVKELTGAQSAQKNINDDLIKQLDDINMEIVKLTYGEAGYQQMVLGRQIVQGADIAMLTELIQKQKELNDLEKQGELNKLIAEKKEPEWKPMVDIPTAPAFAPGEREAETERMKGVDAIAEKHKSAVAWIDEERLAVDALMGKYGEFAQEQAVQIQIYDALGQVKQAMIGAIAQEILGQQNYGKALKNATAQVIAAKAAEAAVEAIWETAKGFAALATYRYTAAGQHFKAAAGFAAVAGVASVAARALYSPPSEKEQKSRKELEATQPPSNVKTSTSTETSRPTQIVNIYANGNLIDLSQLSRELRYYNVQLERDTI